MSYVVRHHRRILQFHPSLCESISFRSDMVRHIGTRDNVQLTMSTILAIKETLLAAVKVLFAAWNSHQPLLCLPPDVRATEPDFKVTSSHVEDYLRLRPQ